MVEWYLTTWHRHVVSTLSKIRDLVLRVQRERDQDTVCRNGNGAASVQVVVVWNTDLSRIIVIIDDAQPMNATLVDMVTAAVGQAPDVERHDGAEHRILRRLLRPFHMRHPAVVAVEQLPLTSTRKNQTTTHVRDLGKYARPRILCDACH